MRMLLPNIMAPGQNHRVELADTAGGNLIADAVKFVPKAAAKTATWTITVGTTGSYKLYAKWPASSAHGTDAQFTVTHAGGASTVTANQRLNGGTWNLLGTYTFNSGSSYKVDLSDQATSGKLAADAIYLVQDGAPTAAFTWTPTFPSAGAYQVYARWPASSANTAAAQYTVTRDGGTNTATLNQKQNGSTWVLLGSYNFTPSSGQKVVLTASADGTTIADAMLFVGAGAQPANLLYVHADHLGSPQKMTDASQATVWDGVFDPFGQEIAVTGLAAMPMRFPGQYADDETGLSYNYFRDYDPAISRYLQSDPIGLDGGINTYAYVGGNPLAKTDPLGLRATICVVYRNLPECQGPEMGGGGGGGGGGGDADIIIAGIMAWIASQNQADIDRQAEYQAYKKRCNETPPPGLNACDNARWRLQRNKDCASMRRAWDNKWQRGRHDLDIANLERGITKLEKWIADNCCKK